MDFEEASRKTVSIISAAFISQLELAGYDTTGFPQPKTLHWDVIVDQTVDELNTDPSRYW